MPLSHLPSVPGRPLFPGVSGHYTHGDRTTVGEVILAPGAVVPMHQHPHEQMSYVVTGQLEFTVGSDKHLMNPGDCLQIPGGALHGCRAVTACRVVDIFSPVREDYR
jgi:quercetin dioxygenase-like cupin family protein